MNRAEKQASAKADAYKVGNKNEKLTLILDVNNRSYNPMKNY